MSSIDSAAVFKARAISIGVLETDVELLTVEGLNSMAAFAFLVPFNANSSDETPLKSALESILHREMTVSNMAKYRRLQFEAHTAMLADTKNRIERTEDSMPRKLPAPERAVRHAAQQLRLTGISISAENEPSHSLIDEAHQMLEDGLVRYIPLERCSCRAQELHVVKGSSKSMHHADLSSDHKIRTAFLRRSLAFDQANLVTFSIGELWTNHLFTLMSRQAPDRYLSCSMDQALLADAQLFVMLGEECRAGISAVTGVDLPLDLAIKKLMFDARLSYVTNPLPMGDKKRKFEQPQAKEPRIHKGKGKGNKGKGKGKGKSERRLPMDLKGMWYKVKGELVCKAFQMGNCSLAQPGETCPSGVHKCCKPRCGGNHSLQNCTFSD